MDDCEFSAGAEVVEPDVARVRDQDPYAVFGVLLWEVKVCFGVELVVGRFCTKSKVLDFNVGADLVDGFMTTYPIKDIGDPEDTASL